MNLFASRTMRPIWILAQVAIAVSTSTIVYAVTVKTGSVSPADAMRPIAWGSLVALSHTFLGTVLIDPDPQKRRNRDRGIHGGLIVVALRYVTGVGLLVAGLFAYPPFRTLCVTSWLGSFLLLSFAELIVFVKGVNRL